MHWKIGFTILFKFQFRSNNFMTAPPPLFNCSSNFRFKKKILKNWEGGNFFLVAISLCMVLVTPRPHKIIIKLAYEKLNCLGESYRFSGSVFSSLHTDRYFYKNILTKDCQKD